jgi:amino acid adenylation domain-containing protein
MSDTLEQTVEIEDLYPLSPMQQGMLFHSLVAPESGMYFEQTSWKLTGALDVAAFNRAWGRVAERHSILRTAFVWEDLDEPLQAVYERVELPIEQHDWRKLTPAEQAIRLEAVLLADRGRGFDLAQVPLMRLALIRLADDAYQFIWSHHHLLLDGWSVPALLAEVLAFYQAFVQGQDLALEPARPYRDYIAWLQEQDKARAEAFWRQTLAGFTAPTPLMIDRGYTPPRAAPYGVHGAQLSAEATAALQALARQQQVTLNTVVQGAWAVLLSRYSGEADVLFGATVSGRPADLPGSESLIGLFINTLPVRVSLKPGAPFLSLLKELQAQQAAQREFEYSALTQVQGWSEVPRGTPLFESLLVFESYPVDREALRRQSSGVQVQPTDEFTRTNYPITVAVTPGQALSLELGYDGGRIPPDAARRMLGHLRVLLEGIAADPEQAIATLPLLTAAERQQVLVEWNDTAAPFPAELCAHQLFEAQAEQTPDAVAVTFDSQQLTYRELNERAKQLAHHLRTLNIGPDTLVGLCVEPSFEMIVGLLGVLKAGGAYVPLDPNYPADRLAFMLTDSQVPVLLTQSHLLPRLPAHEAKVICLDSDWPEIAQLPITNHQSPISPTNLAYVIYTSGSTGQPKGTLLAHRGLVNLCQVVREQFDIRPGRRVLQFAAFSFDSSVVEIIPALVNGATLVLARRERLLSASGLLDLLREEAITLAILPPSLLNALDIPDDGLPALRTLVSAGEACSWEIAERWARLPSGERRRFFNGYGPTENTVAATLHLVAERVPGTNTVPIGRPIANVQVYVLDAHFQPAPIGVPGELHIGGADLARWLPDGTLEFLGRMDHQVKVRGFRIELGEIEAALQQHTAVQQAVVVAREAERGLKRLVAYVVPTQVGSAVNGQATVVATEMRGFLQAKLPDYMVPAVIVLLKALPLTPSGKVDLRALPAPELNESAANATYVAPHTPTEELLASIWAGVLGVDANQLGVHDNFFELGGDSILSIQALSRLREAFQVEVPLRTLFEHPTVSAVAAAVDAARAAQAGETLAPPIVPVPRDGELPLSFAQQRLWFLDQLEPNNPAYHIPSAVRVMGKLDMVALERALNEIVRRHESLRTSFESLGGLPVQVIAPVETCDNRSLPVVDLSAVSADEREARVRELAIEEARTPFGLSAGPLLRAKLLRLADDDHVALLTLHHIVSDGWSMGVLINEVAALYRAFANGEPSPLPDLPVQYADFAAWQRNWLQDEELEKQLAYWKDQLAGAPPLLELPTDRPRPAVQSSNGATYSFVLPKELSASLKALGQQEGVTLFMTLLAAWQVLLARYSGQTDLCVGTPIAGRTRAELEPLIGFFVNTLVLRANLAAAPRFRDVLRQVRETALNAYAHQDLPFEKLVEVLAPERNLSHTPLFQVMLVLDNAPLGTLELPGLTLHPVDAESGVAKFDLTVSLRETPDGLAGSLEYNTDLFDEGTIERLAGHFETLLAGLVADPEQRWTQLPLLTPAERQQLLVDWNQTRAAFPDTVGFHQLVEEQAAQRPDAVAVVFEQVQLSYAELNARANQLAHYLGRLGVGPEGLVGIATERSLELVIAVLGVLKAGAAYVPLDPSYPPERLAFMLQDSGVAVLLTQAHLLERLPAHSAQAVCLDSDWPTIAQQPVSNLHLPISPEHLAYVIYTSGSTGQPKGAQLRHRGLCNLSRWQRGAFRVTAQARVLQFSPFSFDASVWEKAMALGNGARLVLARQATLASGAELARLLKEQGITHVTLPPSVLSVLDPQDLPDLQVVISAGEACSRELVQRWGAGRVFVNAYGPTETTVCASAAVCDPADEQPPSIGTAIANFRLYVLDANGQPVPIGVPGELHIGGIGVARGYLHRPELTAAKFVADPFVTEAEAAACHLHPSAFRLYKTGDLVKYRPDGKLEFLGRLDHQVKVRGFRIELGEVEAVLQGCPGVQDGVVIAQDNRLIGYLVLPPSERTPDNGAAPATLAEIKSHLRARLPEYMVPSVFIVLDQLPLSPSGKVDRKALPAPDGARPDLERPYEAPRTPTEAQLAQLAAELLQLDRLGIHDSFFDVGGHSLLATQFISRVRDAFQVELPLKALFEGPSIAELAAVVEQLQSQAASQSAAPALVAVSRAERRVKRTALLKEGEGSSQGTMG